MNNTIKQTNLSFYNEQGILSIPAKQYDTGRQFCFHILDQDTPFDLSGCSVQLRILKSDGTQFQSEICCSVSGNTVTIDTSVGNGNQILTAPGINKCELNLSNGEGKSITTWNFIIDVMPRVHNGENISSLDSYDVIDKLIIMEKQYRENEETRNAAFHETNEKIKNFTDNIDLITDKAQSYADNAKSFETNAENAAEDSADSARTSAASAIESKSYAVGNTQSRPNENTDNAKYYSEQAQKTFENFQKYNVTGIKGNAESAYRTGNVNITPADIGLGNVNNTSDASKHVSSALSLKSRGDVTAETGTNKSTVSGMSMSQVYKNGYPTAFGNVLTLNGKGESQLVLGWSLTSGAVESLYYRNKRDVDNANWSEWREIAFTTSQVASATKATQDGNGNVIATTYLPRSGGTLTGNLRLEDNDSYGRKLNFGDGEYVYLSEPEDDVLEIKATNGIHFITNNVDNFTLNGKKIEKGTNGYYGICSSARNASEKIVTCPEFTLTEGAEIAVCFENGNSEDYNVRLNINNTGSKSIIAPHGYLNGISYRDVYSFRYLNGNYHLISGLRSLRYSEGRTDALGWYYYAEFSDGLVIQAIQKNISGNSNYSTTIYFPFNFFYSSYAVTASTDFVGDNVIVTSQSNNSCTVHCKNVSGQYTESYKRLSIIAIGTGR